MSSSSELSAQTHLDNQKLLRKIKELERLNTNLQQQINQVKQERDEYLQNVSHQLVAPLNAIKWHIENITEARVGPERARKVLRSIYSQSTIAVHLAKNFALMSNLEEDHALTNLKEPLQEVPICKLLINLADDFQPLGWEKNIQIKVDKNSFDLAPNILVMKPLISQVFSNIIENAIKYSDAESIITIKGRYDEEDDAVSVRISNYGIQLPDDVLSIFRRGYRSEDAKNKHPAGTGFGLYIARRIVEIHEGGISAEKGILNQSILTVTLSVSGLKGKARLREKKNNSYRR